MQIPFAVRGWMMVCDPYGTRDGTFASRSQVAHIRVGSSSSVTVVPPNIQHTAEINCTIDMSDVPYLASNLPWFGLHLENILRETRRISGSGRR